MRRLFRLGGTGRDVERDVEAELSFHVQAREDALVASGLDRRAARERARSEFGDLGAARTELSAIDRRRLRRERRRSVREDIGRDVRQGWRALQRRPWYAALAVLTLALGIGAATSIYAVVDAVLLRPLPFPSPDRLALVWGVAGPERDIRGASYPEIGDWRDRTRSFSRVSLYDETTLNLSGTGPAEQLESETVSPGYLEMLGAEPERGRLLLPEDDRPGITAPVVISYDLWQNRFGADPGIVGRSLTLDGRSAVVVGVTGAGFHGLSFDTDVWSTLLPFSPGSETSRGGRWLAALVRLSPDATRESAQRDLERVTAALETEFPETNAERRADITSLHDYFLGSARVLMLALLGSVGVLLLIACVNVLNLQLVRNLARGPEIAVRYSLGARRARVVRQLLTESLVLAALGGVAGVFAAWWGTRLLVARVPSGVIPAYAHVALDARVLAVAALIVLGSGVLSGLFPALRSSRRGLADALRGADRTVVERTAGRHFGVQQVLVGVEVGLAVALMLAATAMVRSLRAQLGVEPGFRPDGVVAARVFLPGETYPDASARRLFVSRVLDGLRGLGGIEQVAVASDAPLRGNNAAAILRVPDARGDEGIRFYRHMVTPGFFDAVGIRVVRGRGLEPTDADGSEPVAVVSRAFAEKLWPNRDGVGESIEVLGSEVRVIGVVGDPRYRDLTTDLMDPGEDPDVWFSYAQIPSGSFDLIVRHRPGASADIESMRRAVAAIDPSIPLFQVGRLQDGLDRQTANDRFGSMLLALFGAAALTLAAIGLFGVMSFVVSMRRREIAIRIALGSSPGSVLGGVLKQGLQVVGAGAAAGLLASVAAGRLIRSILFGVSPMDPLSVAVVILVLVGTAALANVVPASRAARTDPQRVLRGD
jgi:predicted permease